MLALTISAGDLNILARMSECHDGKYIQLRVNRNECCASNRKRRMKAITYTCELVYLKKFEWKSLKDLIQI